MNEKFIEALCEEIYSRLMNYYSTPVHIAIQLSYDFTDYAYTSLQFDIKNPSLKTFVLDVSEKIKAADVNVRDERLEDLVYAFRSDLYSETTCSDLQEYIEEALMIVIERQWDFIVSKRRALEESIPHEMFSNYSKMRECFVLLDLMGVFAYTKDTDGGGPNLLCQCNLSDNFDQTHSDYPGYAEIVEKYSDFKNTYQDIFEDSELSFVNLNCNFTDENEDPAFLGKMRVDQDIFEKALAEISEITGIDVLVAVEDNIAKLHFPNIRWARRFPEEFHVFESTPRVACCD